MSKFLGGDLVHWQWGSVGTWGRNARCRFCFWRDEEAHDAWYRGHPDDPEHYSGTAQRTERRVNCLQCLAVGEDDEVDE